MTTQKSSYKTIGKAEPQEIKEKGSKFLGLAACVKTKEEVKAVLNEWHEWHPQATHICYAYRLGVDGGIYRFNDDGEPSNSAGAPIYGQLLSSDLTNTLVGVVRYYGGTKLGVGGLKTAYKAAAAEVLLHAQIEEHVLKSHYELEMNYNDMPHVMNILKRNRIEIHSTEMTTICRLEIELDLQVDINFEQLLYEYDQVNIKNKGIY